MIIFLCFTNKKTKTKYRKKLFIDRSSIKYIIYVFLGI